MIIKSAGYYYGCHVSLELEQDTEYERPTYSYRCVTPTGAVFSGSRFMPSYFSGMTDETVLARDLLQWICLRPGDTDQEYFDGYTPEQMDWATSQACEELSFLLLEEN